MNELTCRGRRDGVDASHAFGPRRKNRKRPRRRTPTRRKKRKRRTRKRRCHKSTRAASARRSIGWDIQQHRRPRSGLLDRRGEGGPSLKPTR